MQLRTSAAKDVQAARLVCEYIAGDGYDGYTPPAAHCDSVILNAGAAPGYAYVTTPMANWGPGHYDEQAPTVALQRGGPLGLLKLRTRARISAEYTSGSNKYRVPVMNGYVVTHSHQGGEDSGITQVFDAKWILSKYTAKCRLCWDPSSNQVYWDNKPIIFNNMGYPDCLDHPVLGPVFAPCARFGFKNDFDTGNPLATQASESTTEPARGYATGRARSWTPVDGLEYLQRNHTGDGSALPPRPVDLGEQILPKEIVWPKGFGAVIGGNRPMNGVQLGRSSLLYDIQFMLRKAGAYDLYMDCRADGKSVMTVLDMNPKSFSGLLLQTPEYAASNVGQALNSSNILKNWKVDESCIDTFDEVITCGDSPCVERMVSMYNQSAGAGADNPGGDSAPGLLYLEKAWSDIDELAFKVYIQQYGNTSQAFESACKRWPLVYCAYRIRLGADIWKDTKWAGIQQGGYSSVQPFQLTGYSQDSSNPRNWTPREIIVEYLTKYDDDYDSDWGGAPAPSTDPEDIWREAARYDNLTLSQDGTMVILPNLRSTATGLGSYTYTCQQTADPGDPGSAHPDNGNPYAGNLMRKRYLRIQLAIIGNFPLTTLAGRGGEKADDPNRVYDRLSKDTRFTWLVPSPDGDYVEYLRHTDSRPIGEANLNLISDGGGRSAFPAKMTASNELFTDRISNTEGRMANHSVMRLKDVKRIDINATLDIESLVAAHKPGLSVTVEGANTIPVYGVLKTVVLRSSYSNTTEGQTQLIIAPPESNVLYDVPAPTGARVGGYNAGYSIGGGGGGDSKYDDSSTGGGSTSGGYDDSVIPESDNGSNNNAIKNNPTAGKTSTEQNVKAAKTKSGARAENAKQAAADARARGDDVGAERHEKAMRRLERRAEKEKQRADTKAGVGFATTSVNGRQLDLTKNSGFGEALVGGGFTMAGGTKQVRAGDLGKDTGAPTTYVNGKTMDLMGAGGAGRMFDTAESDAFDKKEYTRLKSERDSRDRASIDRFSSTRQGGAAAKPAAAAKAAQPMPKLAKRGGAPEQVNKMMGGPVQRAPRQEVIEDE